jgi:nitrite reductase (NADH) small subunit
MKHELFPLAELAPGSHRRIDVDGQTLLVVHGSDGNLYALRDLCPHKGASLSHGYVSPMMGASEIGGYQLQDQLVVRCPWHGYEFALDSGRCLGDRRRRVRSFPAEAVNGMVVIDV